MIVCQGCGQAVAIPEGYRRNKIQCPACGVIGPVPEERDRAPAGPRSASRRSAPAAGEVTESEAAGWLAEPAPTPLFDDDPAPPPPAPPAEPVRELLVSCRRCGRKIVRQRECPDCDGVPEGVIPAMQLDDPDDDDPSPYVLADRDIPTCPQCRKEMARGAVVCTACGFDVRRRKRVARRYEPIDRAWDTDYSLAQRVAAFGVAQGIHWSLAVLSAPSEVGVTPFVVAWPLLTFLLAFTLGTFNHTRLERDRRGRVRITKQWRAFFVPLAPTVTEVVGFEGVTTGVARPRLL
ncbi:MAG: hypothetical protein U0736_22555 [Gemmataceae bacterium]